MQDFYSIRKNHLDGQREIEPRMRLVLMDWISEVHSQYHFTQETFHSTISIIDRYLQVCTFCFVTAYLITSTEI